MISAAGAQTRLLGQLTNRELLPEKPPNDADREVKKAYSELVSKVTAIAIAKELRSLGLAGARPTEAGLDDKSGAERQMAGGIGAKRVDVTWATEESGLLLAYSIKTINFKDKRSKNYQKNLTNRRGDLLFECITLHRRFPYSVLVGIFFLDEEARRDDTAKRRNTFENASERLLLFRGRTDPAGRDEQFEHLYIALLGLQPPEERAPFCDFYRVGQLDTPLTLDQVLEECLLTLVTRNADTYMVRNGKLVSASGGGKVKAKGIDDLKKVVVKRKKPRKSGKVGNAELFEAEEQVGEEEE